MMKHVPTFWVSLTQTFRLRGTRSTVNRTIRRLARVEKRLLVVEKEKRHLLLLQKELEQQWSSLENRLHELSQTPPISSLELTETALPLESLDLPSPPVEFPTLNMEQFLQHLREHPLDPYDPTQR